MTITRLLAEGNRPSYVGQIFLRRIAELEPRHAIKKAGVVTAGSYLVPFVDGKGRLTAWVPFVSVPALGSPVYVELPDDPSVVYAVTSEGLRVALRSAQEDY